MRLDEWLRQAASKLIAVGVESASLEAQLLAAHHLGQDRTWVLAHGDCLVDPDAMDPLLTKRLNRFPLAYLLGYREFYGRIFEVTPEVLIPRHETELLVDHALAIAPRGASVLDLGTGSGCIAVTLKLERPDLAVSATDLSGEALEVADRNASRYQASVEFSSGDLFEPLGGRRFDLIVSNPPYVAEGAELMPEVGEHEPPLALFSGESGLDHYLRIANGASEHLHPGGALLLELGLGQAGAVSSMFPHQMVSVFRDLSGIERVLVARW